MKAMFLALWIALSFLSLLEPSPPSEHMPLPECPVGDNFNRP